MDIQELKNKISTLVLEVSNADNIVRQKKAEFESKTNQVKDIQDEDKRIEYSPQQIHAVLNNPNDFPPKKVAEMLQNKCFTLDELERNGLNPNQAQKMRLAQTSGNEDKYYRLCCKDDVNYGTLKYFVDNYPNSSHLMEIREKMNAREIEIRTFNRLQEELDADTYDGKIQRIVTAINDNPFSDYVDALNAMKNLYEKQKDLDSYRNQLDDAEKADEEKRRKEAEAAEIAAAEAKRQAELADDNAWKNVLSILNSDSDVQIKKFHLEQYANNHQFTKYQSEVPAKRQELEEEAQCMPQIQAILNDPNSDVVDFMRLIKRYPSKKRYLCDFMLRDMRVNPSRYDREEMIWLLNGKHDRTDDIDPVFSTQELVSAHVMPLDFVNHILTHQTDEADKDPSEGNLVAETNFKSAENNTDVYFWGVPGSGKTTVLAGLLKVAKFEKMRFRLLAHGDHVGYNYASILRNYLERNLFPQRTKTEYVIQQPLANDNSILDGNPWNNNDDISNPFADSSVVAGSDVQQKEKQRIDKFIQIIDAVLEEEDEKGGESSHKLSIIEMPGERTLEFAAVHPTMRDMELIDELLGEGTRELFMNDNRKVFFFVIDPNPSKTYQMPLHGGQSSVSQAEALEALIEFLRGVPGLLEKVDSTHIILTKSDMLRNPGSIECIREDVIKKGYEGVINDIKKMCNPSKGNVNAQCDYIPYLFTFSLGKVYPGHMIQYRKDDAEKILGVIAANTYSVRTSMSKWDSLVEWMNK